MLNGVSVSFGALMGVWNAVVFMYSTSAHLQGFHPFKHEQIYVAKWFALLRGNMRFRQGNVTCYV